ncbi:MAG: hypothetical protein R3B07_12295 [Polyangiaceae bacterium]
MRRSLKKLFALTALGLFTAAATSGCADNDSQLFVVGVMVPDGECSVTADEGASLYLAGVLDTSLTTAYVGRLLVGNQLTQRGSREETKTETSRIAIRGAEVQIFTPQQELIKEYTVASTGFVNQAPNGDAAYGFAAVTLIDPQTGQSLANQVPAPGDTTGVVVEVRVFGDSLGGSEITSAKLTYPITVCNGCLISCTTDAAAGRPCSRGNDEPIDCSFCLDVPLCAAAYNGLPAD